MLFDSALLPLEAVMVEAEAADWREAVAHAGASPRNRP